LILIAKKKLCSKPVLKSQIRLEIKAPADEKAEHTKVCEHFEEDGNADIRPYMIFLNRF